MIVLQSKRARIAMGHVAGLAAAAVVPWTAAHYETVAIAITALALTLIAGYSIEDWLLARRDAALPGAQAEEDSGGLLKSRRFWVALGEFLAVVVIGLLPAIEGYYEMVAGLITAVGLALIAGYSIEDWAGTFAPGGQALAQDTQKKTG